MSDSLPTPPPEEPVPTWARDYLRVIGISVFAVLFLTLLIGLAGTGLLRKNIATDPVAADGLWAGICAGLLVLLFPFLFFEQARRDSGFRRSGLVPLLLLGILTVSVIGVLAMMTWPFILGDRAMPGTVAAELTTDPAGIFLVLLFLLAATAWNTCLVMNMIIFGWKGALVLILPFLGMVFLIEFAGINIFENPPSTTGILLWGALALVGIVVLGVFGALRNVIDRPPQQATEAERAEFTSRYWEERNRYGHGDGTRLPGIDSHQPPQPTPSQLPPRPAQPPQPPRGPQPQQSPQPTPSPQPQQQPRPPRPPRGPRG